MIRHLAALAALAVLAVTASGCTTTEVISANPVPVQQASSPIPSALVMDVGVVEFDPGMPDDPQQAEKQGIIPDVRRAESRYIAYHLKETLEGSGNWGAVRVLPDDSSAVDLTITGKVLQSDGELLRADVRATDASGRIWINRQYQDNASKFSYRNNGKSDPFQDFYNEIANDLLQAMESLPNAQRREIRQIAGLRFAADLAPDAFGNHLEQSRGRLRIRQLPADNDTMLARVERIKEREYLFVDTLDEYYARFYREMAMPYHDWRQYTYEEAINLRDTQRQARNRLLLGAGLTAAGVLGAGKSRTTAGQVAAIGAVTGGIGSIRSGLDRYKSAEIHREALQELSQSLGAEISPVVMEIEGQTVELQGSIDGQYAQWRDMLKRIYAEETGLPLN